MAFAGIGRAGKIFSFARSGGRNRRRANELRAIITAIRAAEAAELIAKAKGDGLELVTTEKDLARMRGNENLSALQAQSKSLRVRLALDDENKMFEMIRKSLRL